MRRMKLCIDSIETLAKECYSRKTAPNSLCTALAVLNRLRTVSIIQILPASLPMSESVDPFLAAVPKCRRPVFLAVDNQEMSDTAQFFEIKRAFSSTVRR